MRLMVAVTGGIGAGKSTVSRRLGSLGAAVIDSDRLAREVVAPGSPGLVAVAETFGAHLIGADGALDRAALAAVVFADPAARRRLEAITHPLVRARFVELTAQTAPTAVVVNDIPILVDLAVAASFHLVIGVHADPEHRVSRLVDRGLSESDARARLAAQIPDEHRRLLCDVWLSNDGATQDLEEVVDRLWVDRLLPFRDALVAGVAPGGGDRPDEAARQRARYRLARAAGVTVDEIVGSRVAAPPPQLASAGFLPDRTGALRYADPGIDLPVTATG